VFDAIREKLAELFGGASEQLGVNPEDITSQIGDAATSQVEEATAQVEELKDGVLPGEENNK
jgi:hypothetical protein